MTTQTIRHVIPSDRPAALARELQTVNRLSNAAARITRLWVFANRVEVILTQEIR